MYEPFSQSSKRLLSADIKSGKYSPHLFIGLSLTFPLGAVRMTGVDLASHLVSYNWQRITGEEAHYLLRSEDHSPAGIRKLMGGKIWRW